MDFLKIAIAAFSATNIMTTFSYLLSVTYDRLFKEPVLLNYILDQIGICPKDKWKGIAGWLAHYVVGLVFVTIYQIVWLFTDMKFGWLSAIILGAISGVVGILGWRLMFRLPDKKPNVPLHDYYVQLFFAHIVFACAVVVAFKIYEYDPVSHLTE
ncbi:MAG TPA: hypothetical protein VF581_11255 [Flavobacterium sp.]|jgi:hypothetical protein